MRSWSFGLCAVASLSISASVSALTMSWTPVGNPGNAGDTGLCSGCGAVSYSYSIGTYEVTNAQYAEFLNAKAASDPLKLSASSGIARSGSDGSYTYTVIPGRENQPVDSATFWDAARVANWMNNGQGDGD